MSDDLNIQMQNVYNYFFQIIHEELFKNVCLAVLVVWIVTVILLQNLLTSVLVISCVIFTLVNLLGSMYFFNIHIEMISSLFLLLSSGLTVDYAMHIGLEFTHCQGTRNGVYYYLSIAILNV